jgi:hypothetical protein
MKRIFIVAMLLAVMALGLAAAPRVSVNTYQVTGPVLELTSDKIVVQKGKDRWELARDASTKTTGDPKVGSKVTIEYRMTATTIKVAAAPAGK